MSTDFNTMFNRLEVRVAQLEQDAVVPSVGLADVFLDEETGETVVEDQLDWTVAAGDWESYTTVSPIITDELDPDYPGGDLSSDYGRPEANLLGSMCVFNGVVRRTGANLAAGTRHDSAMFGLPLDWRPVTNIILPCLMGNGAPDVGPSVVGIAWVEVSSGLDPLQAGGRVAYVAGTVTCNANTGWIALQGIFPCEITEIEDEEEDEEPEEG